MNGPVIMFLILVFAACFTDVARSVNDWLHGEDS